MAIDTAEKRRLVLNSGMGGVDYVLPAPDGEIGTNDKLLLLHGYFPFNELIIILRHALAMCKLWPARSLLNNE